MRTASQLVVWGLALTISVCVGRLNAAEPTVLSGVRLAPSPTSTHEVHSQPSFLLSNKTVSLAVTEIGGHMAPVQFYADSDHPGPIEPYYISPWQDEPQTEMPAPVLNSLRGDFFCLPFGGNAEAVNGEIHPPHGEIAGAKWTALSVEELGDITTLTMEFETRVRPGKVTKQLSLHQGHNVVYSKHTIEGFAGRVPLGHHATLAMPEKDGAVHLASSKIRFGMTCPGVFSDPQKREYQALLPGVQWTDLTKVPVQAKDASDADLSRLPGRYGFADLVQLVNDPAGDEPAWMTATYPDAGYVWFSLKDAQVLASTVFWMEYHGRHGHPWNGRNNCLGLEDVTSHFADGLAPSIAENVLSKQGVPTTVDLTKDHPTVVNYIQGVVRVPSGFERVETIQFHSNKIVLLSTTGHTVSAPVQYEFLKSGQLK